MFRFELYLGNRSFYREPVTTATAALGAAGISAGSSLLGGTFSGIGAGKRQKRQIKAAKEMQQIGNEFTAQENEKARLFQSEQYDKDWKNKYDQWKEQLEYDSAKSQRARWEEAGFNPYLIAEGGATSQSVGMQGVSTPSAPSHGSGIGGNPGSAIDPAPAYMSAAQGVSAAINSYFQNRRTESETMNAELDAMAKQLGLPYVEQEAKTRLALNEKQASLFAAEAAFFAQEGQKSIANTTLLNLQADSQRTLNKYLDSQQQADLMIKSSQAFLNFQQGRLSANQCKTEIAKQIMLEAEAHGKHIDNRVAEATAANLIESLQWSYIQQYQEAYADVLAGNPSLRAKIGRQAGKNDLEVLSNAGLSKFFRKYVNPILGNQPLPNLINSVSGGLIGGKVASSLFPKKLARIGY